MKTITLSPIALVLLAMSGSLAAETLNCTPNQKFVCSSVGCKTAPAKVRAVIDTDKQTYSRCDKYNATMSMSGIYLNVLVPGKSVTAKVEIPSLQYFETISIGLAVYNSFGKCRRN